MPTDNEIQMLRAARAAGITSREEVVFDRMPGTTFFSTTISVYDDLQEVRQ